MGHDTIAAVPAMVEPQLARDVCCSVKGVVMLEASTAPSK